MRRALIYVPQGRSLARSLHSVLALDTSGYDASLVFDRENNSPGGDGNFDMNAPAFRAWYGQAAIKVERARCMALAGGYDLLMSVEDDIIVPPDALQKLDGAGADIAYGLAVWRNPPHCWSATLEISWEPRRMVTLDCEPARAAAAWGEPVETAGCGLMCTVIRREVLERISFYQRDLAAADWGLAIDARAAGFRQISHCGVICGHIAGDGVYWPDPVTRWRKEELT